MELFTIIRRSVKWTYEPGCDIGCWRESNFLMGIFDSWESADEALAMFRQNKDFVKDDFFIVESTLNQKNNEPIV